MRNGIFVMVVALGICLQANSQTEFGNNAGNGGPGNSAFGYNVLHQTTGGYNSAFGEQAMEFNLTGFQNVAFGQESLRNNSEGNFNVAIGRRSLFQNTTGLGNTGIGFTSLWNSNGNYNTALGISAGWGMTSGNNNIFIGSSSAKGFVSGNNNVVIGRPNLGVSYSNTIVLATGGNAVDPNSETAFGNVRLFINEFANAAFGNQTPQNKLDVEGAMAIGSAYAGDFIAPVNGLIVEGNTGIGTGNTVVGSKLEIVATTTVGSGLRFRRLTSTSPVTNNLNGRFLTVNPTGDVILQNLPPGNGAIIFADGTNTTIDGNGSAATPYQVNAMDTSIYLNDGELLNTSDHVRTVRMLENDLWFNTKESGKWGRVYIGSGINMPVWSDKYRLYVESGILTERVKVAIHDSSDWQDHVFAEAYELMPLKEVESYIIANSHLPGIESAEDLVKNGLDLGEMQSKQMGKIEELTLHLIAQNKQLEQQAKEIAELKAQMQAILSKK